MTTIARLTGLLLLMLVGYHYINRPLGFSVAGSIATVIFAGCLTAVYKAYAPNPGNWAGWALIAAGCLLLAAFRSFNLLLFLPALLIVLGFRLAELPFELSPGGDSGSGIESGGSFGDSCGGGDAGGCGD
ncbi:MAG: hypothetical protein KDI74_03030 [Gammaproteobacteria bacterium]|nr:hypothetical protein [Gammaproteobacteria bacterium]